MNTPETVYPVLFTLREVVSGNGFVAGVYVQGRGSMVFESDEGWWLYGVEPGGLAESGNTPKEAHLKFVADFKEVLFDIASDATSFEAFKKEVERILTQVNKPEADRWENAVKAIRSGKTPLSDPFMASLPKWKAEDAFKVVVQRLDKSTTRPTPKDNKPNVLALPVAA
ncbi:MAG: hypothetical protein ACREOH_18680 [Candidatus Entotheonellia bacterium]